MFWGRAVSHPPPPAAGSASAALLPKGLVATAPAQRPDLLQISRALDVPVPVLWCAGLYEEGLLETWL